MDEFQMLEKMEDLDKLFWLIRSFAQIQHNVSYIFTGSISQSSEIINELNNESEILQQIRIDPFTKKRNSILFQRANE